MIRPGTIALLVGSLAGGVATSQGPELAQQYRQRLNGALEEMRQVVADFDADAARNALRRDEALERYEGSAEAFLRDRGLSVRRAIDRYEHLVGQAARLEELPDFLRPVAIVANPDGRVMSGAWRDFEPAVPITPHGLAWTAAGLLAGFGLVRMLIFPWRKRRPVGRAAGRAMIKRD